MEYAQARIQARFGNRPGPMAWQRLQGIDELQEFLEAAKRAGLGHWVGGPEMRGPEQRGSERRSGIHRVELLLRDRLRALIRETASWLPERWQRPVLLTAQLVDLPALAHLAQGGSALGWMKDDAVMAAYLGAAPPAKHDALLSAAQRERLFKGATGSSASGIAASLKAWLALWRESWPSGSERASVSALVQRAEMHLASFAACETTERAEVLRDELDRELRREFRRSTFLPGAALAYLAMEALDFERVRSMLVDRVRPAAPGTSA